MIGSELNLGHLHIFFVHFWRIWVDFSDFLAFHQGYRVGLQVIGSICTPMWLYVMALQIVSVEKPA